MQNSTYNYSETPDTKFNRNPLSEFGNETREWAYVLKLCTNCKYNDGIKWKMKWSVELILCIINGANITATKE